MLTRFDPTGTIEQLERILARLEVNAGIHGVVIFASEHNLWDPLQLKSLLSRFPVPVVGGIFPALIYDSQVQTVGTLVLGFEAGFEFLFLTEPELEITRMQALLESRFSFPPEQGTLMVLADGRIPNMGGAIEALFSHFGLHYPVIGGGAGSASANRIPCIFNNVQIEQDALVVAFIPELCSTGVQHGWAAVGSPMWVTRSDENRILSLDCRSAVEIYVKQVTRELGNAPEGPCASWSAPFPLGLHHPECEPIVRDLVGSLPDGSLLCFGDIPEGSRVQLLRGDPESLIRAAEAATQTAMSHWQGVDLPQVILVFDCVSRVSFLGDRVQEELKTLRKSNVSPLGAVTLGEIASIGEKQLEYWNKTLVVAWIGS
jgi:hypothetical protein